MMAYGTVWLTFSAGLAMMLVVTKDIPNNMPTATKPSSAWLAFMSISYSNEDETSTLKHKSTGTLCDFVILIRAYFLTFKSKTQLSFSFFETVE